MIYTLHITYCSILYSICTTVTSSTVKKSVERLRTTPGGSESTSLENLAVGMRTCCRAPFAWLKSEAWMIPKFNGKTRSKAVTAHFAAQTVQNGSSHNGLVYTSA